MLCPVRHEADPEGSWRCTSNWGIWVRVWMRKAFWEMQGLVKCGILGQFKGKENSKSSWIHLTGSTKGGAEDGLSGSERVLLFQRTWACSQHAHGHSQTPVIAVPGDSMPSSGLQEHLHTRDTYTCTYIHACRPTLIHVKSKSTRIKASLNAMPRSLNFTSRM